MSRLARFRDRRSSLSTLSSPSSALKAALRGDFPPTYSGVSVGPESALSHLDVYACVRAITDEISALPLHHYRVSADGLGAAQYVPLPMTPSQVLDRPAPGLTQGALFANVAAHLNLRGNAFVAKYRDDNGMLIGLFPISPYRVSVGLERLEPRYTITPGDGSTLSGTFGPEDILHFKGLSLDGILGLSPIACARQAIGLGMALEEWISRFFSNNARPSGVIQVADKLSDDAHKRLKRDWDALHQGLSNSHRVAILEDGATWHQTGAAPEDLAFVEQRKLSSVEIARIFRLPAWVINAHAGDSMTYSTVEGQRLAFYMSGIRPWLANMEQTLKADGDFYAADAFPEFNMDAGLRADAGQASEIGERAVGGPYMTPNEWRRTKRLPPIDGGDKLRQPLRPKGEPPQQDPNANPNTGSNAQ